MSNRLAALLWPPRALWSLYLESRTNARTAASVDALYNETLITANGETFDCRQLRGSAVLIVNTASKCGFTPQYAALERLHRRFGPLGLRVLAFPSGDFLGQEFGSDREISEFCAQQYELSFPVLSKGHVRGSRKQPVFRILTETPDGGSRGEICWNFEKFLIDRSGRLTARWRSWVGPESERITATIQALVTQR
jgi:glutathione peroxidase